MLQNSEYLTIVGTSAGSYIYVEASFPRIAGDKARLYSVPFSATQTNNGVSYKSCSVSTVLLLLLWT